MNNSNEYSKPMRLRLESGHNSVHAHNFDLTEPLDAKVLVSRDSTIHPHKVRFITPEAFGGNAVEVDVPWYFVGSDQIESIARLAAMKLRSMLQDPLTRRSLETRTIPYFEQVFGIQASTKHVAGD